MPGLPRDDKPEDDGSPRFEDNGPDLDAILDRELTLVPGARAPKESNDDRPPELPPKLSRRQNGVLDLGTGAGGSNGSEETPPAVPRRKDRASSTVRGLSMWNFIIKCVA